MTVTCASCEKVVSARIPAKAAGMIDLPGWTTITLGRQTGRVNVYACFFLCSDTCRVRYRSPPLSAVVREALAAIGETTLPPDDEGEPTIVKH